MDFRLTLAVLIALSSASCAMAADVYKCEDAGGTVKYQQTPCSTTSEKKVRVFYEPDSDQDVIAEHMPPAIRARFDAQVGERRVAIGMTVPMVKRAWGVPKKVNSSIRAGGLSEQWVYRDEYVYFENGVVTSIQTSR